MIDWAQIRYLSRVEHVSGRAIARRLGVSTHTVAKALASDVPPKYERESRGSMVDRFVPAIQALLDRDPTLKATVIAERVGFNDGVSTSVFRARVRELKLRQGVVDPVDRLVFHPGEQVQCDLWFPRAPLPATGVIHPVLTMIACWSRFLLAVMIPTRQCGDILAGMNVLLARFGGLPDHVLWDNESGLVSGRRLIPQASAWAGSLGLNVRLAKPRDPETKGRIERANGYLDSSFEPARHFTDIHDFNSQLDEWLTRKANQRLVRATGARPVDLLDDERFGFDPLPPVMPDAAITARIRLSRDYHVRLAGCDYSIDPVVIGRFVTIRGDLDRVTAYCDESLVADHRRCFTAHKTITDPIHVAHAAQLRHEYQTRPHPIGRGPITMVESRDLSVYDQLWNTQEQAA